MTRPPKIVCVPEGVWSLDGIIWHRTCPYCSSVLNHIKRDNAIAAFTKKSGCKCKSAWSRGLTAESSESLKAAAIKSSKTKKEKFASGSYQQWNKGLTKDNNKSLAVVSEKSMGRKHTIETRKRISDHSKRCWADPVYREKVITRATIGIRESYASGKRKLPIKYDTKPELAVECILEKLSIRYTKQYPIWASYPRTYKYVRFYDFYLPDYNLIIEVHGDYWHGKDLEWAQCNKIQQQTKINDIQKQMIAIHEGKRIDYIWETDTKNNNQLYEKISNILHTNKSVAG